MISNTRAIILARVSTVEQDPENQIPACLALVERLGLHCEIRCDVLREIVSGTKGAEDRPELRRVLKLAHAGSIGALVVWALDRIGRNMWNVVDRFRELEGLGVRVFSVSESWTVDCPADFRPLLLAQAAWWAGMERKRIVSRVKAGLDRRKAAGHTLGAKRKISDDVAASAWVLFYGGWSWSKIADQFRLNRGSISSAVHRWGRASGLILEGETAEAARERLAPIVGVVASL